jgi:multidrug resistance protein MdtO
MHSTAGETLREELRYDPERARRALQITISVLIVVLVMVAAQMPFVGIAPYLVFLLSQDETLSTRAASVLAFVVTLCSCLVVVLMTFLAFDAPWLRVPAFVALFYGGFYLMRTFSQPKAVLGALVILGLVMVAFDQVPTPTYLFTQLAWLIAALAVVIASSLLGGWLVRIPSGRERLRQVLQVRMTAIERCLRNQHGSNMRKRLRPLPGERTKLQETLERAILVGRLTARQGDHYAAVEQLWTDIERAYDTFEDEIDSPLRDALADALVALRSAILEERELKQPERQAVDALQELDLPETLRATTQMLDRAWTRILSEQTDAPGREGSSKMLPDDFRTNPLYASFAMRATLATMGCYLLMVATHWYGIHTCMVTTVATALATTGAQVHKQTLRISGAVIGGALGVVMVTTVLAHDESLFTLLLVVGLGTLAAAWISLGSTRISYAGWQIALAFFMTVLQGPHPPTDLGVIGDRWIGIAIGILAMQAAFRVAWPQSTAAAIRGKLHEIRGAVDAIAPSPSSRHPVAAREISADLALAADTLEEAAFESRFRTTDQAELAAAGQSLSEVRARFSAALS